MDTLEPRSSRRLSRRSRERRAYRLVLVGGSASALAVVGFLLALVGVVGWWLPLLAAVVVILSVVRLRGTTST